MTNSEFPIPLLAEIVWLDAVICWPEKRHFIRIFIVRPLKDNSGTSLSALWPFCTLDNGAEVTEVQ